MEEEVRILLRQGLAASPSAVPRRFGQAMRAIFEPLGGIEAPETGHQSPAEPPDFSGPNWDPPE
jgi:hypothetical protein